MDLWDFSFLTSILDWNWALAMGAWSPNHWTTRELPSLQFNSITHIQSTFEFSHVFLLVVLWLFLHLNLLFTWNLFYCSVRYSVCFPVVPVLLIKKPVCLPVTFDLTFMCSKFPRMFGAFSGPSKLFHRTYNHASESHCLHCFLNYTVI